MTISIEQLAKIDPTTTVLFFGAGSSIQSGAPSVSEVLEKLSSEFGIPNDYSLAEMSSLVIEHHGRRRLIDTVKELISRAKPTGSLLNVPLYNWKNIYTTNYDELIEASYKLNGSELSVYSSNFDFTIQKTPEATKLYKLHGTIGKDTSLGDNSRIIISESDYDHASDYREFLLQTFKADLTHANLIIIGYSLRDPLIKEIVEFAIKARTAIGQTSSVSLLCHEEDENRAMLYEKRGLQVAFGGIDNFFSALDKQKINVDSSKAKVLDSLLDEIPVLRAVSVDVAHEIQIRPPDARALFNGKSATYSDIENGLTFRRSLTNRVQADFSEFFSVVLLGASGTGKTSLARQILVGLSKDHWECWEHKDDHSLQPNHWRSIARKLKQSEEYGVLFIDEAHSHLYEVNQLIDYLVTDENANLKLLIASAKNHWNPRTKSVNFHTNSRTYVLRQLDSEEIDGLLNLSESNQELATLIDSAFQGFSRPEKHRRMVARCDSDTFVCLRNIFSTEKFDDIILREYSELDADTQNIYRLVAAMESSGVKVHRQLITRIANIDSNSISNVLHRLEEIISEYTVSERDGIYGWKARHPVISEIITSYKYAQTEKFEQLFENVISNIVPTYEIEIRTIRQICNFESGIGRLSSLETQNRLYRQLISIAPGERVPRHRLIRNLIRLRQYDKADTEIRLSENDFKNDGPVSRYSVRLMLARAEHVAGLMEEDKVAIIEKAAKKAENLVAKQPENGDMLRLYCDVGVANFRKTGKFTLFDKALVSLKKAEAKTGDPDLSRLIVQYDKEGFHARDIAIVDDPD